MAQSTDPQFLFAVTETSVMIIWSYLMMSNLLHDALFKAYSSYK